MSSACRPGACQKPTKAQKRREAKAAEEAEREARIAEEQAAMGPSEREQEAAALAELLAPMGLRVHEIPVRGAPSRLLLPYLMHKQAKRAGGTQHAHLLPSLLRCAARLHLKQLHICCGTSMPACKRRC